MKILIVDDRPLNRELLTAVLVAAGHEVIAAADGIEALQAIEHDGADAVISDILMPKMDGYRFCYEIRQHARWRHLPFIFYTATYTSDADEKLAIDLGADAYLRKPATPQAILETLNKVTSTLSRREPQPEALVSATEVLKEYSERLVSKLEEKNQELQLSARELANNLAERKRAEDSLQLFRTLVDRSNDAFEIIDPETGRFLDVNGRGCEDLGYSRKELQALTVFDIDPTVDKSAWPALQEKTRAAGSITVEGRHRRKDGTEFPVEVNIRLVRLERDYLIAAVRDITARKQAEAVVQQASVRVAHRRQTRLVMELALLCVLSLALYALAARYDWFEAITNSPWIQDLHQVDELVVVLLFIAAGLTFIAMRRWRESQAEIIAGQQTGEALRLLYGELELRVKQRTSELASANDALRTEAAERKRTELAIARTQAQFQFIFDSVPVGISWMVRDKPETRIVNPAHARLTGVPIAQRHRLDLYRQATHPDDRKKQDALHQKLTKDIIEYYTLEKRYVHPNGAVVCTELTVRDFHDSATGEIQEITTLVDLTERKLAEDALHRSEERLQQFIRYCPLNVAMFDRRMCYLAVSESWMKLYGAGRESIIGLNHYEVVPNMPDRWKEVHQRCLAGAVESCEADPIERPGMGWRIIRWEVRPWHDRLGEIGGIMLMSEDITERKQAEEALRYHEQLLRETGRIAKVGGWEFDPATNRGRWTEEVALIHDLPPSTPITVETGLNFYHGESRVRIEAALKEAIAKGTPYDLELEIITAANKHKWVRTIAHPVVENGKVVKIRGSFQDISELKAAEAASQKQLRELRRWHEATLGREDRILELKREVNDLLARQHQPPRYSDPSKS